MDSSDAMTAGPARPFQAPQALDDYAVGQIKAFHEHVIENTRDVVWAIDPQGLIIFVSPAIRYYGYTAAQVIGRHFDFIHTAASARQVHELLLSLGNMRGLSAAAAPPALPYELEYIDSEGRSAHVEARSRVLLDSAGNFAGLVGVSREIGDRVKLRAELETLVHARTRELELSEARYRLLAENIKDVILTFDLTLNCNFVTPSIATIGYTPAEFQQLMLGQILSPASYTRMSERYVTSMSSMANPEYVLNRENLELEVICKDGHCLWAEFRTSFLRGAAGEAYGILAVGRNITDRKQAEIEKADMLAELMQAQKMESVGRLAGGIAHDFNNMLTAMMGYADLLGVRAGAQAPELLRDIEKLQAICERAAGLTKQLLAFSRRQMLNKRPLDINHSISAVDKMLGCLVGPNIAIKTSLAADLWPVNADPLNIEQVLMNLIINAIDAMPGGGQVRISTANLTLKPKSARVGQFVLLSITDTGNGMDAATQATIFEPFFTTKPRGQGTGLGLSTAYGIVKQHEGWIEVESAPGRGSTFRIYLPACAEAQPEQTAPAPPGPRIRPENNGRHILVVEDEPEVRALTVRCLKLYGYQVSEAPEAQTALRLASREDFDLIFSDVIMPGMTGLCLAEKLLALKPDCRIMLTSGHMDDKSQWPLIEQLGLPFLAKPFSIASLTEAIAGALKPNP